MSAHQNILLATDLSPHSASAAAWAYTYAQATGARVILAHIIEISIPNWFKDAYAVSDDAERRLQLEDKVRAWYSEATGGAKADSVVLRVGHPHDQLRELVGELDIHMIIIAQSGKGAVERILSGSLARSLVAAPPCAVVVVDPSHNTAFSRMEVTVATDLTDKAEQALLFGAFLARVFGGQLDVIHATQLITAEDIADGELPHGITPERIEGEARKQMEGVVAKHVETLASVDYAAHVLMDSPVRAVQSFVGQKPQDLVVLGGSAHNVITHNMGRISLKLMDTLPCSIMVVPVHAKLVGDV